MMQETEKFIEAVKMYPCIWNVYLPMYKCRATKDAAWREIIRETGFCDDIDSAKDKWKKLKDAFREALNKRKKDHRRGKSGKLGRPYKFQHVMQFLIPILDAQALYCGDRMDRTDEVQTDEDANDSHMSSQSEHDAVAQAESDNHDPAPVTSAASQRQGYQLPHYSEFLDLVVGDPYRKESTAPEKRRPTEFDALDRFFLSMAENTKKVPEHLQLQVKKKVFNAVMEAEEANVRSMYYLAAGSSGEEGDVKPVILPH